MDAIKLTLPVRLIGQKELQLDTRTNHLYRPEANEDEIAFLAVDLMRKRQLRTLQGPVVLSANMFFQRKQTEDIDHLLSTLLNGLKGSVFKDDRDVKMLERFSVIENSGQDCVVLEIRPAKDLNE